MVIAAFFLSSCKDEINTKGKDGRAPLSWAAENGHEAVVRLLLDKGADIESKNDSGQTPLSWAAENRHEAVVRQLKSHSSIFVN